MKVTESEEWKMGCNGTLEVTKYNDGDFVVTIRDAQFDDDCLNIGIFPEKQTISALKKMVAWMEARLEP